MAMIRGSQPREEGFNSLIGYCGCSITASTSDCGSENMGSIPIGHIIKRRVMVMIDYYYEKRH